MNPILTTVVRKILAEGFRVGLIELSKAHSIEKSPLENLTAMDDMFLWPLTSILRAEVMDLAIKAALEMKRKQRQAKRDKRSGPGGSLRGR